MWYQFPSVSLFMSCYHIFSFSLNFGIQTMGGSFAVSNGFQLANVIHIISWTCKLIGPSLQHILMTCICQTYNQVRVCFGFIVTNNDDDNEMMIQVDKWPFTSQLKDTDLFYWSIIFIQNEDSWCQWMRMKLAMWF